MTMTLSGSGTIAGLVAGGLPDATITSADLASNAVDAQTLTLLNATGTAPVYACRAWVNFNGTGTVAIRASGNVSSITDNGTGDYTVNFTNAMPDVNYSAVGSSGIADNYRGFVSIGAPFNGNPGTAPEGVSKLTSSVRISIGYPASAPAGMDQNSVNLAIFR